MTHLDLENLTSDYLEGLLEPALKREVEAHLSVCPSSNLPRLILDFTVPWGTFRTRAISS